MSVATLETKLGDVLNITSGFAFKSAQFSENGGLPLIRIRDVLRGFSETKYDGPFNEQFIVRNGDLLVSMDGEFRACEWKGGKALLNQRVCRLEPIPDKLDHNFLRYAIGPKLKKIEDHTPFVTVKHLSAKTIRSILLPLPPLSEQQRIARILDRADAIRRKRQQALALTEQFLRATFLEMFGDPVTNPKGWAVVHLEDMIDAERGISYGIVQRGPEFTSGVPVIRISNIRDDTFNGKEIVRTAPQIAAKFKRTIIKGDELLLGIRGTVGNVAQAPIEAAGWNVSREIAVIPLRKGIDRDYIHHLMLTDGAQDFMTGNIRGIAQRGINLSDVRKLPVPYPDKATVKRFADVRRVAGNLDSVISTTKASFDNLFNSLVQRAFRGDL